MVMGRSWPFCEGLVYKYSSTSILKSIRSTRNDIVTTPWPILMKP